MNPQPDATPACEGAWPEYFDDPIFYPMGLQYCDGCEVQLWCLRRVDPARNYYDGVAGGAIWNNGQINAKRDPTPAARIYLGSLPPVRKTRSDFDGHIDEYALQQFMAGQLEWNKTTRTERMEAARRWFMQGELTYSEIGRRTHLSSDTISQVKRTIA